MPTPTRSIDRIVDSFQATPEYLAATGIRDQFFGRIADLLTIHAIGSIVPAALPVGALLGVFEFKQLPADPAIFQVEHVRQVVRWDRLSTLFTDPTQLMREVYGWGTPNFRGNLLVGNIARVVEYISADAAMRAMPRAAEEQVARRQVPEADLDPAAQLFVSLDKGLGATAFDAGLTLYPLRPTAPGGVDGGIGLSPYVFGTAETSFPLSDNLSLVLSGAALLQGGIALLLRAGKDPEFLTGLIDGGPATSGPPAGAFTMALRSADAAGGRQTLFSAPSVTFDAAAITAGLGITTDLNPSVLFKLEDGRLHIASDDADGFLGTILPKDGITTTVDLEASWSHRDGLNIKGGAGLSTVLDVHKKAGPLRVDSLALAVKAGPQGVNGTVGVTGGASIGPVTRVGRRCRGRGGAEVLTGQSRSRRSQRAVHAAQGHRPVRRRARRRDRRRLPLQRRGPQPLCGGDAALAPRRHHAQGLRPDRHAHARRQPRLLADRLHHRRRLPPDPAAARIPAAGHRRHGRREPHVRSGCPAPGPEERHAGHAAVPARSGRQRAGVDPQSLERVPGAAGQLPARASSPRSAG